MKKTILLLTLLFIAQGAFAYVEEGVSSDVKTLQGKGYSQAAIMVVETARMQTQGYEKDYVPFYSRKFYSDVKPIKWYQMAKRYIDPAQDEGIFGSREYEYSNGWFDTMPSYNGLLTPNDRYQRYFDKDIKRMENTGKVVKGSGGKEKTDEEENVEVDVMIEDL